ncbi:MAG: hypothetical protein JW703_02775 [Candidatus Diapherotrites archaeon]|nr:hypothetical protein [Candidatus Diapherotrites archaeon]
MKEKILIVIALLVLLVSVNAITAFDAVNFVKSENHFLLDGETIEQPYNPLSVGTTKFWVIPVTSNDLIVTYFVINYDEKSFSDEKIKSREAISTAYFLRELINLRERFSESQSNEWIVSAKHSTAFNSLKQTISNEIFELNLIQSDMNSSSINSKVTKVQSRLNSMNSQSEKTAKAIDTALQEESDFISNPSKEKKEALESSYENVFTEIKGIMNELTDYSSAVNELKEAISTSGNVNAAVNIQRANSPNDFLSISGYFNNAQAMETNIDSIDSGITSKADSFIKINEEREKRNHAFTVLYEKDSKIKEDTGEEYSIKELVETVSNDKNDWNDKTKIPDMKSNWNLAVRYFEQEKYELAEQSALNARKYGLMVYSVGIYVPETPELFTLENTALIVGLLIGLLIIIYVFNNKDKLIKKEEEKKYEF